jgi:heme-degrading monooxygenase HmoA
LAARLTRDALREFKGRGHIRAPFVFSGAHTMRERFARLPDPPYYIVAFSSLRTEGDNGYAEMAQEMTRLALAQPGCLGAESVRGADGFGITNSYFRDEEAIHAWKENLRHLMAQRLGKARWYRHYALRVARVERAYEGPEGR